MVRVPASHCRHSGHVGTTGVSARHFGSLRDRQTGCTRILGRFWRRQMTGRSRLYDMGHQSFLTFLSIPQSRDARSPQSVDHATLLTSAPAYYQLIFEYYCELLNNERSPNTNCRPFSVLTRYPITDCFGPVQQRRPVVDVCPKPRFQYFDHEKSRLKRRRPKFHIIAPCGPAGKDGRDLWKPARCPLLTT